ncbi:MAG TPA: hypothetical protein DDY59_13045 [Lachnospiraceae bacterium]|jgi:hypothetical protein|nr:hypothetical protein [Lachnospiraceae bacterium]
MIQGEYQGNNVEKIKKILFQDDEAGLELFRLMQLYLFKDSDKDDVLKLTESNIPPSQPNETGYLPIGTWSPVFEDGEVVFVRNKQADTAFWESNCKQFCLKKKSTHKRVCVIGESVAAGMFFTPHISPTKTLSEYLELHSEGMWDVIDLTRNSMNAGALLETCRAALQINPDYIVVIAGNNWYTDITIEHSGPISRRRMYVNALDKGNICAIIQQYKEKSVEFAKEILRQIDGISSEVQTQFLFVLPAVNYKDWERRYPLHWLDNKKTSKWYEKFKLAVHAIENKDYESGLKLGVEMIQIDGGTNATSSRIVANCLMKLGRNEEAYAYCAAESDNSLLFDEITSFPGMSSLVRKEIKREEKSFKHIFFFDMEEIFQKFSGEKVVGSPFFVDYCHLSPEGYKISMAPIAGYITNCDVQIKNIDDDNHTVGSFYLATAYFCIALYNTHLNRPVINNFNMKKYVSLFQKAVDCCETVLDIMELYIKARGCQFGTGFALSKSGQKLSDMLNSPLDLPITQQAPGVDAFAITCICEILTANGRKGKKLLEEYQRAYINLLDKGVDLINPQYMEWINSHTMAAIDSENGTWRNMPYHKSWWPWSYFTLASDTLNDLEMEIVLRLPTSFTAKEKKRVSVVINNKVIKNIFVIDKWTMHKVTISAGCLSKGFNRVSLEWPELEQNEEKAISDLKDRYVKGRNVEFYPIFGEIFSMRVRKKTK